MAIPKKIFFFWGNEQMSWMRYMTLKSFCQLNPDWDIRLYYVDQLRDKKPWSDWNEQDFFNFNGKDYSEKIKDLPLKAIRWKMPPELKEMADKYKLSASHLSNFFKWHQLSKGGGIYSDLDILFIRPMDQFYEEIKYSDTAICFDKWMSIGLLGSSGNNQFYNDLYHHAMKVFNPARYQVAGVLAIYSLLNCEYQRSFRELVKRYHNVQNFPYAYFYPFSPDQVEQAFMSGNRLSDETIGFHWFAAHPVSQRYNNLLNEENYKTINVTFTELIKQYL